MLAAQIHVIKRDGKYINVKTGMSSINLAYASFFAESSQAAEYKKPGDVVMTYFFKEGEIKVYQ